MPSLRKRLLLRLRNQLLPSLPPLRRLLQPRLPRRPKRLNLKPLPPRNQPPRLPRLPKQPRNNPVFHIIKSPDGYPPGLSVSILTRLSELHAEHESDAVIIHLEPTEFSWSIMEPENRSNGQVVFRGVQDIDFDRDV